MLYISSYKGNDVQWLKVLSKFEKPSTDYIVRFLFAKKSINEH